VEDTQVFANPAKWQAAEPESHVHAHPGNQALWSHLVEDDVWLWSGYRGGLVMPADSMHVCGLTRKSFLDSWAANGASPKEMQRNPDYSAYELGGHYSYSAQPEFWSGRGYPRTSPSHSISSGRCAGNC